MEPNRKKDKIMCQYANVAMCQFRDVIYIFSCLVLAAGIYSVLGVVCHTYPELPLAEMVGQLHSLRRGCLICCACAVLSVVLLKVFREKRVPDFPFLVIWILIGLGAVQALWGLKQIYGYAHSNHSLFTLTGSFFNPGPYSGYLAMILPLCLNEYLKLSKQKNENIFKTAGYYISGFVVLLIICVLPAGMSRSAWIAAILSAVFVMGFHYSWHCKLKEIWKKYYKKTIAFAVVACLLLAMVATFFFHIKKDSADGRLFMWKISVKAIAEKPLSGYGKNSFAMAYGNMQEKYFSDGNYAEREEYVAGTPEYAFNEYLQIAVEFGIPVLIILLVGVGICLYIGIRKQRTGICGAILSVLIFAFSSYPFQIPVFAFTFIFLLIACIVGKSSAWLAAFALFTGLMGFYLRNDNVYTACRKWQNSRMLYQMGDYNAAIEAYTTLYPELSDRPAYLFEYGHAYHKAGEYEQSTEILLEAMKHSCDPMIFNIIGKNYQSQKEFKEAERYYLRAINRLPGRIYPYYLLAKLYAEPGFYNHDKLEEMRDVVLTKQPKVMSTAIRQMREDVGTLSLTETDSISD